MRCGRRRGEDSRPSRQAPHRRHAREENEHVEAVGLQSSGACPFHLCTLAVVCAPAKDRCGPSAETNPPHGDRPSLPAPSARCSPHTPPNSTAGWPTGRRSAIRSSPDDCSPAKATKSLPRCSITTPTGAEPRPNVASPHRNPDPTDERRPANTRRRAEIAVAVDRGPTGPGRDC